eukprot:4188026-Amphidinium_carterae.2
MPRLGPRSRGFAFACTLLEAWLKAIDDPEAPHIKSWVYDGVLLGRALPIQSVGAFPLVGTKLALLMKLQFDVSVKRRFIVDLLRSGANAQAKTPEWILLPRITDDHAKLFASESLSFEAGICGVTFTSIIPFGCYGDPKLRGTFQ